MAKPVSKLIFGTSAINKLKEDKDCSAILGAIGIVYQVGLTETAMSEISEITAVRDMSFRFPPRLRSH
jgi:hypothetical protein